MLRKFKIYYTNLTTVGGTVYEHHCTFMTLSPWVLIIMRNVSGKICTKIKDSFMFNKFIYRKSCRLWDNVEKYCSPGQATDDNMAHLFWILDNWGRRHKLRIYNIVWLFHGKNGWANTSQSYITRTITLLLTLRQLMLYMYGAPILDVSRSHTTTHHSR